MEHHFVRNVTRVINLYFLPKIDKKMTILIKNNQMEELNKALLLRFVRSQLEINQAFNFDQVLSIVNESLGYGIAQEDLVIRYIKISQEFAELFRSKPAWMKYVLEDNDFEALDKLDYIEERLREEETEYGK